jgi:hypothetical protein
MDLPDTHPMAELSDAERGALQRAAGIFDALASGDGPEHTLLVPALFEDLFEELEGGGSGRTELLSDHRRRASQLRALATGGGADLWAVAAGCSWALRLTPQVPELADCAPHLAAVRQRILTGTLPTVN